MNHYRGLFITFEGTEGVGKSTLIKAVAKQLSNKPFKVTLTREPGGTPLAEKIRDLLLKVDMSPRTELLLYEAARAEHLLQTIIPALQKGHIVLCDRFTDSSLAYQAAARGLAWKDVTALNDFATYGIKPDLTVFLDGDPAVGLKRAKEHNRFEAEGVLFLKRVRGGFIRARKEAPRRWLVLKAYSQDPDTMAQMVMSALLKKHRSRRSRGKTNTKT